jgi:hypothetical protein
MRAFVFGIIVRYFSSNSNPYANYKAKIDYFAYR